jgi:phosphoribosylglycinamide formyltransferase-1
MSRAPGAFRIAVLASGRGSNLQALIDAVAEGALDAEIVLVAGDRADAPALRRAEAAGIATCALDPKAWPRRAAFDAALFAHVAGESPDLVVLAGYLRILDADVVAAWAGRMVNVHPSLLPKYPGLHTHRRVLEAGDREHGATVHYVTAELDGGPAVAQAHIDVRDGDSPETLAERLLGHEHRLLVATVAAIACGRVVLDAAGVHWDGARLRAPLRLAGERLEPVQPA